MRNIQVKAFANSDHAYIVWYCNENIANCIGFTIMKKENGESDALATPLNNRIPFAGEKFTPGDQQSSVEWPIQRFGWSDFSVKFGDKAQYMVIPMLMQNGELVKDENNASDWSSEVTISTGTIYQAYFNRGIIPSQFFARGLKEVAAQAHNPKVSIKSVIDGPDSPLRNLMGGTLATEMFSLLDGVIEDGSTIYCALYELNQQDLINKLCKLGNRAHVILANGTGKSHVDKGKSAAGDENSVARAALKKAKVNVFNRMVDTRKHFAHNKFMIFCDKNGKNPKKVWMGSTNWTANGLFAQVNNGVLVNDAEFATYYLNEWNQLKDAENAYPEELIEFNKNAFGTIPRVWFAPTPKLGDLADANNVINSAKEGVLFLMFNPGPRNTLFNTIENLQDSPRGMGLFIHGVLNQDPGGNKKPLIFFHKGKSISANWNDIIAQNIKANTSFWTKEPKEMVTIHSKVIVVDPFGSNPVLMTGSHNMGPKASGQNDDNLNFIFDGQIAMEYAANILSIYDHYRWRYSVLKKANKFKGLTKDINWMEEYKQDPNAKKFFHF
ncbi:MAG: phospholipase D-like domain-containing protein [Bacteroidia bacterium]